MKEFNLDNYGKFAEIEETMPLNRLTFTGTSGTANVTIRGVTYLATFATSLAVTAQNFVGLYSEILRGQGIALTNVLQSQVETITLTGTSGTATVAAAGGLSKTVTFALAGTTDLTQTATDFVTSHAAAYLAVGITITSSTDTIIFTGTVGEAFTAPTITNATGDLAGTVAHTATTYSASVLFTLKIGHIAVAISAAISGDLTGTLLTEYTPDFSLSRVYKLTSQSNFTLKQAKNPPDNALIRFELTAGGAHSCTWDTTYQFPGGTEHTQTSGGLDILEGRYNSTAAKVYIVEIGSDVKA